MDNSIEQSPLPEGADALLTFHQAAEFLGVPYWKVQRAAKIGVFRTVTLLNSRRYIRRSEIDRVLREASSMEGAGQ